MPAKYVTAIAADEGGVFGERRRQRVIGRGETLRRLRHSGALSTRLVFEQSGERGETVAR
jgi:hypothetical protein